jgi:hypothetical protein
VAPQQKDRDSEDAKPDDDVHTCEDNAPPAERLRRRSRQYEGAEHDRHDQQLDQRMSRVERVRKPRRSDPDKQHGGQQHQCLERASPAQMLQQVLRESEERQDEHQVKEQFQEGRPPLLGSSQQLARPTRGHRSPVSAVSVRLNLSWTELLGCESCRKGRRGQRLSIRTAGRATDQVIGHVNARPADALPSLINKYSFSTNDRRKGCEVSRGAEGRGAGRSTDGSVCG